MNQYIEIATNNYCVDKLKCICKKCKNEFWDYLPTNYELVCFSTENGEKRFLPTYGKYGYLYLLSKLVDEWREDDEITKEISDKFETEIQKLIPYKVTLFLGLV